MRERKRRRRPGRRPVPEKVLTVRQHVPPVRHGTQRRSEQILRAGNLKPEELAGRRAGFDPSLSGHRPPPRPFCRYTAAQSVVAGRLSGKTETRTKPAKTDRTISGRREGDAPGTERRPPRKARTEATVRPGRNGATGTAECRSPPAALHPAREDRRAGKRSSYRTELAARPARRRSGRPTTPAESAGSVFSPEYGFQTRANRPVPRYRPRKHARPLRTVHPAFTGDGTKEELFYGGAGLKTGLEQYPGNIPAKKNPKNTKRVPDDPEPVSRQHINCRQLCVRAYFSLYIFRRPFSNPLFWPRLVPVRKSEYRDPLHCQ